MLSDFTKSWMLVKSVNALFERDPLFQLNKKQWQELKEMVDKSNQDIMKKTSFGDVKL